MKSRIYNRPSFRAQLSAFVAVLAILSSNWLPAAASGPITPLNPAEQALTAPELAAQEAALASSEVQRLINGQRAEVFEVYPFFGPYAPEFAACRNGACYQVDIYNFDQNATVTAIVDQGQAKVLAAWQLANSFPQINQRL